MKSSSKTLLLLIGALFGLGTACSSTDDTTEVPPIPDLPIATRYELRNTMRRLWTEHVVWTRSYLVSAIGGLPDASAAAIRLQRNQNDLGDAVKPYYGIPAGDALTALLHDHITLATQVVTAALAQDKAAFEAARAQWYLNADQIAAVFGTYNPGLDPVDLQAMMHTHLDLTLAEATARLTGDWSGDVVAYDAVVTHALEMADAFTDAISVQTPGKMIPDTLSPGDAHFRQQLHELWQAQAFWTRNYLVSAIGGLPDGELALARLFSNQVEIGNSVRPFTQDSIGDSLAALMKEHVIITTEIVTASKSGDAGALAEAKNRWYVNGRAVANLFAKTNEMAMGLSNASSTMSSTDLYVPIQLQLDATLAEVNARISGDWAADVAAYDQVQTYSLQIADQLGNGLVMPPPPYGNP